MQKPWLDSKGQFAPFRLLIGAVLGLLMLGIVLGIVHAVEQEKYRLSSIRFADGLEAAVNLPNGSIVKREKVFFKQGEIFTVNSLAKQFNLSGGNCLHFSEQHSGVLISPDQKRVEMESPVETDVYYDCVVGTVAGNAACPIDCRVSFDEELTSRVP